MSSEASLRQTSKAPNFLNQPKAVWATAFAAVVGFMSIGLVDPILTSISKGLNATPTQVSLLFTSYFFVTSVMMIFTGFISSRLGGGKTLLLGAFFIIVFSALSGMSSSVTELVGFRAGWGFGNALFVVTALSVIVASSRGGTVAAILMYESALGLGISAGPLLGAFLGAHSWRYPFFGTAVLMTIGFIAIWLWLPKQPLPVKKTSILEPIKALGHSGLLTTASSAFFYNYAFFTVLAFVPFVLDMSAHAVGMIFFGWGVLLALFSVIVAPRLQMRFSGLQILFAILLTFSFLLLVIAFGDKTDIIVSVIASGALIGICNTVYTEMALEVSEIEKHVASAGYNFVRWFSGVIAPFSAPLVAQHFGSQWAFIIAAIALLIAPSILFARRASLGRFAQNYIESTIHDAMIAGQKGKEKLLLVIFDKAEESLLDRAVEQAKSRKLFVHVAYIHTYDVFDEDIAEPESYEASEKLLKKALCHFEDKGVYAEGEVVESSKVRLYDSLEAILHKVQPGYLMLPKGMKDKVKTLASTRGGQSPFLVIQ
ncbi:MFS transporter [Hydrogenovibrio marinus]|uniref:MFS transporter n=1 Tax=Hydrogenovibrio marinus TaxID=28885 RepID=A0A066ZYG0_HYDMR|nr:MFS transporter [Hydrogenovibrio marinus]KDN95391.1 hypothetical protein EI16_03585 [Hydrogenovibrio marinus]BBN59880.1 MFS transporter [Hydrogenovibrio marinus]